MTGKCLYRTNHDWFSSLLPWKCSWLLKRAMRTVGRLCSRARGCFGPVATIPHREEECVTFPWDSLIPHEPVWGMRGPNQPVVTALVLTYMSLKGSAQEGWITACLLEGKHCGGARESRAALPSSIASGYRGCASAWDSDSVVMWKPWLGSFRSRIKLSFEVGGDETEDFYGVRVTLS